MRRTAEIHRKTKETDVEVTLDLDGTGKTKKSMKQILREILQRVQK